MIVVDQAISEKQKEDENTPYFFLLWGNRWEEGRIFLVTVISQTFVGSRERGIQNKKKNPGTDSVNWEE